jgi:hypothetical protein
MTSSALASSDSPVALLRPRRQRPNGRAEKRDKLAVTLRGLPAG